MFSRNRRMGTQPAIVPLLCHTASSANHRGFDGGKCTTFAVQVNLVFHRELAAAAGGCSSSLPAGLAPGAADGGREAVGAVVAIGTGGADGDVHEGGPAFEFVLADAVEKIGDTDGGGRAGCFNGHE